MCVQLLVILICLSITFSLILTGVMQKMSDNAIKAKKIQILCNCSSANFCKINLSNAEATFVQRTKRQHFLKNL